MSFVFAAESASGIAALGVDVKALVLQIMTFVLVFLLLKKFALSKIVSALEERRNTINQGVKLGQELAAEKEKLSQEVEKVLRGARLEADKIMAAGREEANLLMKEAEAAAAKKTEVLLEDAQARIKEEMERARKALEKQMLSLVAEATEKIIKVKLDPQRDQQLIEKALQEVRR